MAFHSADMAAPALEWRAVVPGDTSANNLPAGCRGIYVGGAGNVAAVGKDGTAQTFTGILAGTFMPIGPLRINSTSTTATLILALY